MATQWIQFHQCTTKTSYKKSLRLFSDPFAKQKIMYTNSSYHGIIELRHFIDPRRMTQLRERECRIKQGTSPVMLQSCLDETHLMEGEVEFYAMVDHHFLFFEGPVEAPPIWQQFLTWHIPRMCIIRAGIWRDVLVVDIEELEKSTRSKSLLEESIKNDISPKKIHIPNHTWNSKIVRRRTPRNHSKT